MTCSLRGLAQHPRVDIPGSELRTLTSTNVAGQEYDLHILLPGGYANSNKKYPVVYVMDSQWDFPLVKSIYGQQYYDGFIPELIIVGVTWGGKNPNPDSLRARDYTPTREARLSQSGGADQFLSFMKNELFPFMEKNYRVDPVERSLVGCSLGGLFTLYTLFTQPTLFTGYAAASPHVGWDNEVLYKFEKSFNPEALSSPRRVYMTIGDVERSRPTYERFATKMAGNTHPNIVLTSKVLENTGHSGTKSETYSRGLQFIFQKPDLSLSDEVLSKIAGRYQTVNGNLIEIKKEGSGLALYYSPANKYMLHAASETEFYSKQEMLNLKFRSESGAAGLELARFGSSQFIKKLPK